jgi:acetylornithine deacetylase/succinyl-diaminopimelate desuccinylase-like protein
MDNNSKLTDAMNYAERNAERFLSELMTFLSIPSISTDPEYADEVRRAARFVENRLEQAGLEATLIEGEGHPLVKGVKCDVDGAPTALVYGHYDVQPIDPLEEWETPPFEPVIKNGMIRARGCADDKGPMLALIAGIESWVRGAASLPLNLIVLIEGEEECGGSILSDYVRAHKDELDAKALIVMDSGGHDVGVPSLAYGLRGICSLEVRVDGPSRDLHSGNYGGAVRNPTEALCELISSCRRKNGNLAISGLTKDVVPITAQERDRLNALDFDEGAFLAETGSPSLYGEEGYSTLERIWNRPTFEVNGVYGGYQGEGEKTIIPAWAGAKITMRLVPNQNPQKVLKTARKHLEKHAPKGVRVTVEERFGAPAVVVDIDSPLARGARRALREGFGVEPVLTRQGGSIPIIATFVECLGVTPLLLGTYRPGEKAHSPNEQYHPEDFQAAIRTTIALMATLSEEMSH